VYEKYGILTLKIKAMNKILERSSDDLKNNSTKETWGGMASVSCNVLTEIEKELDKLKHHEAATVGLFAIDFHPNELLNRFIDSQSDACGLLAEDAEQLQKDWERWLSDKNEAKNPFFRITKST
jgi:hypothetical protein